MAKNSQFSLNSTGRGAHAGATEFAIGNISTRIDAVKRVAKFARITKISIKTITIR